MSKDLKGITHPEDTDTVWRYMSFEKFANILATESLFFSRADKFDDKFEGYIPESIKVSYEKPLKISVKTLIDENDEKSEVIVSPHADKWVAGTLELIVEQYGFQFPVNRSKLLDPPT